MSFPFLNGFSQTEILAFSMVLLRLSAFLVAWPVFGATTVPALVKVLFSLILAILLFPVIDWSRVVNDLNSASLIWVSLREIFVGVVLGFVARSFFYAITVSGEFIGISIGFSGVQLFNPSLSTQGNVMEQFQVTVGTLIYLAMNGHHYLLTGLAKSFEMFPLSANPVHFDGMINFIAITQKVMVIGLQIAAPVVIAILILNVAMGIVGRAVPQVNVLVTSFPVNILAGMMICMVSIPVFIPEIQELLNGTITEFFGLMKSF